MRHLYIIALTLFVTPDLGIASTQTVVLPRESVWRYEDSGTDLGSDWTAFGYDDTGWASGPAVLGYGDSFVTTTLSYGPNPNDKYPTAYFRISFDLLDDPADIGSLLLSARFDDGFVLYLNGTEVTRQVMPAGPVGWGTYSSGSHEATTYETVDLTGAIGELVPGTNTVAVEVHQHAANSSDLAWDGELVYSEASVLLLRGPYLQIGGETATTVRWRTSTPVESRVLYGSAPGTLTETATVAGTRTEHEVRLTDLTPDTRYYYAVASTDTVFAGADADHYFETHPPVGTTAPFRVWIVGDSGEANQAAADVRDAFIAYTGTNRADIFLMLGDNAYDAGTDAQYQAAVFETYPQLLENTVLWPTRGNHDVLHSGGSNDYYDIFTLPTAAEAGGLPSGSEAYYSFDFANVHFVCLDSEGTDRSPGGAMLTWLAQDLAATDQEWIIAFWHHPPYTKGSHNSDNDGDSGARMTQMRENALPILEAGGVDLVLSGHSHAYERSFLLDGHYGYSFELLPQMILDGGDGSTNGDGAYEKPSGAPHAGAVYTVAGSSSKIGGGPLDHPVMVTSQNRLGSVVLDVEGGSLHVVFLDDQGVRRDDFTILHPTSSVDDGSDASGTDPRDPGPASGTGLGTGTLSAENPAAQESTLRFHALAPSPAQLTIHDSTGRSIRTLLEGDLAAGDHEVVWDTHSDRGEGVPSGVYFAVLTTNAGTETTRIVVRR